MAALPLPAPTDPTLDAIASAIQNEANTERPRPYLGMSSLGRDCERELWYSLRWCGPSGGGFDVKSLLNFEDGHRTEDVMAAKLRKVPGVTLHTVDPSTGQQFGFSAIGGHLRGHIDGAISGLLQAPKTWHVWEHKASEKGPADLARAKATHGEKAALAAWNPTYYGQAIMYMHAAEMSRHYLTCSSPGGRMPWTSVRTDADPAQAQRFLQKAERIIFAPEPLAKLSEDPAFWKCKGCALRATCHGEVLPPVSCRTCLHATPERDGDGRWSCAKWGADIPLNAQEAACPEHRYIPALLSRWGEAIDASEAEGWVLYRAADGVEFRNGAWGLHSFTSTELAALTPDLLRSDEFMAIRARYAGTVAKAEAA